MNISNTVLEKIKSKFHTVLNKAVTQKHKSAHFEFKTLCPPQTHIHLKSNDKPEAKSIQLFPKYNSSSSLSSSPRQIRYPEEEKFSCMGKKHYGKYPEVANWLLKQTFFFLNEKHWPINSS